MKKITNILIAIILAVVTAFLYPTQVLAANTADKYISEIKLGVGKKAEDALASLDGYEILKGDDGKPVDLNKNAGGGVGSKGDRVVYLGYKRTSNRAEAITDLAVMNMKGGYSTDDYDALMEKYLKEQIIPFVNTFIAAIEEYRENYNSSNPENNARAHYIHDALNKLTDDDCGGAGLGDLLLNETKFEMGDAAYNALSEEQKKQHADIITIIAQANGQATLLLENLLIKAADTAENTWLDRFIESSYEDMEDETGLVPSKAYAELSKIYYDDAMKILEMWDAFKAHLDGYDNAVALLEEIGEKDLSADEATLDNYDITTANSQQTEAFAEALARISTYGEAYLNAYADVICKEYLGAVEYDLSYFDFETEGDTLLDLFTLEYEDVYDNIECLYPLVASLSAGQRAGLDLITLQDLILIGINDAEGYKSAGFDEIEAYSVYTGVDREIYAKGGVGLTSDALRQDALSKMAEDDYSLKLGGLTYAAIALTGASLVGLGISLAFHASADSAAAAAAAKLAIQTSNVNWVNNAIKQATIANGKATVAWETARQAVKDASKNNITDPVELQKLVDAEDTARANMINGSYKTSNLKSDLSVYEGLKEEGETFLNRAEARSALCSKLAIGLTVVIVVVTAITVWLTFRDLQNHYKVDFTPIPNYMVDEKDITAYNSKGEKIIIKNQAAYYKAVLCNRTDGDYYDVLGDKGDLNGYVGKQWLALYAERNEANDPILADSLKFSDKDQIPAGYEKGIHMFGSAAVENLNNPLYVWKSDAPKVYVYFKLDVGAASTAGSGFSFGSLGLGALGGALIGVLGTAVCTKASKKKKETEAA